MAFMQILVIKNFCLEQCLEPVNDEVLSPHPSHPEKNINKLGYKIPLKLYQMLRTNAFLLHTGANPFPEDDIKSNARMPRQQCDRMDRLFVQY